MSQTNATIRAATGFRSMKPEAVFSNAQAIYTALNGNANVPGSAGAVRLAGAACRQPGAVGRKCGSSGPRQARGGSTEPLQGSGCEDSGPARQVCSGEL